MRAAETATTSLIRGPGKEEDEQPLPIRRDRCLGRQEIVR
jgi:hypothetical protein